MAARKPRKCRRKSPNPAMATHKHPPLAAEKFKIPFDRLTQEDLFALILFDPVRPPPTARNDHPPRGAPRGLARRVHAVPFNNLPIYQS